MSSRIDWVVSESDVVQHRMYTEDLSTAGLNKILEDYGLNTSLGYTSEKCTHRSLLTEKVTNSIRYSGYARQDGKWAKFIDNFLNIPLEE